ncbi:DUF6481 family protein [Ancylobacter sp. Lp-2]|uniref:DUF6481 family protein n=1 Tax=Ancylobacter sp. Lp-2 TaxID=2881339 RepID=UPI001E355348|nr:DUF6481 family protein [Ancylobacter sp. Lp-2]MCB4770475.1 DUF6481 family protein [Ancylobacter sp. Lp-2]
MKITDTFEDRRRTSAAAKARLLANLATRPSADDPAVISRATERKTINKARVARQVARQEAAAAAVLASDAAAATAKAEAKAKRDERYAARKRRSGN